MIITITVIFGHRLVGGCVCVVGVGDEGECGGAGRHVTDGVLAHYAAIPVPAT